MTTILKHGQIVKIPQLAAFKRQRVFCLREHYIKSLPHSTVDEIGDLIAEIKRKFCSQDYSFAAEDMVMDGAARSEVVEVSIDEIVSIDNLEFRVKKARSGDDALLVPIN
jgi:hypothetical protein